MKCTIIAQDIPQKIAESIFMYKGTPYYFKEGGGQMLELYDLEYGGGGPPKHQIKFTDDHFDFSSIPLGYVNYKKFELTAYLSRIPVRKVKQGINQHNSKFQYLPGSAKKKIVNVTSLLFSQGFVEMAQRRYPSLEQALHGLRKLGGVGEIAINLSIALSIDEQGIIKVFYKNQYVGWIQPNKYIVHVKSDELGWVISKYLSHVLGWQID
jgi:hypothetical protein